MKRNKRMNLKSIERMLSQTETPLKEQRGKLTTHSGLAAFSTMKMLLGRDKKLKSFIFNIIKILKSKQIASSERS